MEPKRANEKVLQKQSNGIKRNLNENVNIKMDGQEPQARGKENPDIPDGIYYIVLADLIGSTQFAARMGNDAQIVRIRNFISATQQALNNAKMSNNSGRYIKSVGDAALIVFSHFPDVVQWSMEFDGALSLTALAQEPLQARICVHAGEVRFENGEARSLAINQLFKMEKRKKVGPGIMILSDIAYTLAVSSLYPQLCIFKEYGTVRLDEYPRPMKLFSLIVHDALSFLIVKTDPGR